MTVREKVEQALKDHLFSSRFPYTYHHDFIRNHISVPMSRSEVAAMDISEDDLFATAYVQDILGRGDEGPAIVDPVLYKECLDIAKAHVDEIEGIVTRKLGENGEA